MNLYVWIPIIVMLIGLAVYLFDGRPKHERVGWVLFLIGAVVLALVFLGGHWHHVLGGRWP